MAFGFRHALCGSCSEVQVASATYASNKARQSPKTEVSKLRVSMKLLLFDRLTKLLDHLTAPRQPFNSPLKESLSSLCNFVDVFPIECHKECTNKRDKAAGVLS